jgi:hypothetical protein
MKTQTNFSSINNCTLAALTWNLAGEQDYDSVDFVNLIQAAEHDSTPDIFIFGF